MLGCEGRMFFVDQSGMVELLGLPSVVMGPGSRHQLFEPLLWSMFSCEWSLFFHLV